MKEGYDISSRKRGRAANRVIDHNTKLIQIYCCDSNPTPATPITCVGRVVDVVPRTPVIMAMAPPSATESAAAV